MSALQSLTDPLEITVEKIHDTKAWRFMGDVVALIDQAEETRGDHLNAVWKGCATLRTTERTVEMIRLLCDEPAVEAYTRALQTDLGAALGSNDFESVQHELMRILCHYLDGREVPNLAARYLSEPWWSR